MNLEELQRVQGKERRTDSLQNLRPSFYREVGEYIADLKRERERAAERADDPFSSPEVNRLTDEIETATDVVEAIYERRMGKIVKQASLAAAGMPADDEGLTAEEADLFEDLVERIRTNKGRVLDVLEGTDPSADGAAQDPGPVPNPEPDDAASVPSEDGPETAPPAEAGDAPTESRSDADGGVSAADVMGGTGESASRPEPTPSRADDPGTKPPDVTQGSGVTATDGEPGDSDHGTDDGRDTGADDHRGTDDGPATDDVDRMTVRITRDVGSILGIDDREYSLSADDVVTLPERNATPLVEREAAERLE